MIENKKAVSLIVGMVILIAVSLTLASMIYFRVSGTIAELSPSVYCTDVSFEAEIINSNNKSFLNVVNLGDIEIKGFEVKSISEFDVKIVGEVDFDVGPGSTESAFLEFIKSDSSGGRYLIVPKVIVNEDEQEVIRKCDDKNGFETQYREVVAG